jgi:purine nucleosidase
MKQTAQWYRDRLKPPNALARLAVGQPALPVVIDSDVANEIDDQFALAWALLSPALDVQAIYACPFSFAHRRAEALLVPGANPHSRAFNSPEQGMERSYEEAVRVIDLVLDPMLGLAGEQAHDRGPRDRGPKRPLVLRGSAQYLPSLTQACNSEAAHDLIQRARAQDPSQALYVLALGCLTNIASALLMAPDIASRMVLVWTAGFPSQSHQVNHAFNMEQDVWATQVVLNSGTPLAYLPGYQVGVQLRLSYPEMQAWVQGRGAIGNYLHELYTHNPLWDMLGQSEQAYQAPGYGWVIWDLVCMAWVLNEYWVPTQFLPTPLFMDDKRWAHRPGRPPMREAWNLDRAAIFSDFFRRLPAPQHTD